jgi:hypothetical protein
MQPLGPTVRAFAKNGQPVPWRFVPASLPFRERVFQANAAAPFKRWYAAITSVRAFS